MSQVTDWSVDNAGGAAVRAQLNGILAAIQGSSSGTTAPSPTVAGMLWMDTGVSPAVLRVRNSANTAWLAVTGDALLSANGYAKLPSGVIVQFGNGVTNGSGVQSVTFPVAFPALCAAVLATPTTSASKGATVPTISTTGFTVNGWNPASAGAASSMNYNWLAIGY